MAFEKVGIEILRLAAAKGFSCLFLEHSATPFQRAYSEFIAGGSYEETVLKTRIAFFAQFGVRPKNLNRDKSVLEAARNLGFRILAIDRSLNIENINVRSHLTETLEAIEQRLSDLHRRNELMASRIVLLKKIDACKGGVLVVGARHLSSNDLKPISKVQVETIPELLRRSGVEPLIVGLVPKGISYPLSSFDIILDE